MQLCTTEGSDVAMHKSADFVLWRHSNGFAIAKATRKPHNKLRLDWLFQKDVDAAEDVVGHFSVVSRRHPFIVDKFKGEPLNCLAALSHVEDLL
jgi:hypothetical protein